MCNLFKHKVIKKVAWVGKSGREYPYNKYQKEGTRRLPDVDLPYTVQVEKSQLFKCCEVCDCEKADTVEIIHEDIRIPRGEN